MGWLVFVLLGVFVNLSQSMESQDLDGRNIVLEQNVTGVLGEEVYLRCLYKGPNNITYSSWNRLESSTNEKKMAGYRHGGKPFRKDSFSTPASITNLTVKVAIDSLDMEGRYTCAFSSDEEEIKETMFLTVIARPEIKTHVEEDVLNGTHYQTVTCSALKAKPMAHIRWEIRGVPLSEDIFSINTTNSKYPSGTSNIISILKFPIILNNESRVSCVVHHEALTEPNMTDINLQTFVSPNVSMEMVLIQKEGKDFLQVICTATGGRPHPDITWVLPSSAHMPLSQKHNLGIESVAISYWFPSDLYEGENVTCIFGYPLLPALHTRSVTLPTYRITSLKLRTPSSEKDLVILEEESRDVIISMEVMGNVPNYTINCTKDGEPMPKDVEVIGSNILIKGPVGFNLSGHYQCQASYHKQTAKLELNIEVKPRVLLPATFPPNISFHFWKEVGNIYIECLASNASPAANVSWVLPQDLNGTIQSNITSSNGSQTVRSILTLPVCVSQELKVECVVEHLDLDGQEKRSVALPTCVAINVTLQSNTVWENGVAYTEVNCSADNAPPAATIAWDTEDCASGINASELSSFVRHSGRQQEDTEGVWSTAHLSVQAYAGCTVICVLKHQGLGRPERKSFRIPSIGPPASHLAVGPLRDSALWAAVCEYRGDAVVPNISWVISNHNTTIVSASIQPTYDDIKVLVNTTYEFELHQYEGKNLTCVIQHNYGEEERRTISVPKYFISSIVVLNKTSPLHGNHGQHTAVKRIALQEALPHQRIVFRVNGNTPTCHIKCFRPDGSAAHTVALALVFAESVSEQDSGLYTCHASWYHHKATVFIQVDVTSQETYMMTFILICFSSAAAITLFLFVTMCVLCKRSGESRSSNKVKKQRESLAGLVQTPCSPELNGKGPEYAELVRYSIVIDVKSTV
ncbi:uncharacterized protein si:ch211-149e23.4 [Colossoma macropomum]|uniref:uncharacterized protein si:ch211-149e23.4 n=1 Tax=Colossoma macropomum TaxID=42526 RepID=UPI0018647D6B|nr:uncharacterized protein si:ch211-149e23.4 [Colossoma macropomum]XP_036414906.1 uncharacterized protein si:ch211-149e23.4 [Colossoma macropomum]